MTIEGKISKLLKLQQATEPAKELYGIPISTISGEPYDGRYDGHWLSQGRTFRPIYIRPADLPPGTIDELYALNLGKVEDEHK